MENQSRSRGHRRHASSVALSGKHSSELPAAPRQPSYDDIFSDPHRFGAPPGFASRVEDYHEIFNSSRASRGSSIPVLDLPPVRESEAPVHPRSSLVDYSKIFQGFADSDFAATYDQLFPDSDPIKELDSSSDDAWTLGETESLSEDTDSLNSFEASHQAFGAKKQFNMSYHKTNQRSRDGTNGTTHIAQLHVVPGFTHVVDEEIPLQRANGSKPVPPKTSFTTPNMNMSGDILDRKVGKNDEEAAQQTADASTALPPTISSNINIRGEIVCRKVGKKDGEIAQQRSKESKATTPKISPNMNTSGEIVNRRVGKKDEEAAQQRTNESGAAPPKISPYMSTSGEIVNRIVSKKEEEIASQITNEIKTVPPKISPNLNTSGEIVNRKVGKKDEETAQQRTNESKAAPPKVSPVMSTSGEIVNRKTGKKNEEATRQRTNESKAAPPKRSPSMNASGEIVDRKMGKEDEETAQQRTNESKVAPTKTSDMNTSGEIVNRKISKRVEETPQQRTNESKAAPTEISLDVNTGGEIVNRKVGKKVEETPQQRTNKSKATQPKISVVTPNMNINGEMVNRKDLKKAASHILNGRSNRSASEGDLKFQSVSCGRGPYQNSTSFIAQETILKKHPTNVSSVSNVSLNLDNSKGDFYKSNASNAEGSGTDASKDASSCSPSLSDEELDAGSDAAASSVAVRRAIAEAQARIRIAKEAMKRKDEGLGSSFKCMLKDDMKAKQKRGVKISHDVDVVNKNPYEKCERVVIAEDICVGSERQNIRKMDSVSPNFDDEEFFDAKEAPEEINDKVSESFLADYSWDGAVGEEAVKQLHKLAYTSEQKPDTMVIQQAGSKIKMESMEDYEQKEKETTKKIFEQPVETAGKMKASAEAQEQEEMGRPTAIKEWEEQANSLNPVCGINENIQNEQNVKLFSDQEEHEEKQKAIREQDNVDKLKISHERLIVNEFEAQGWEENKNESRERLENVKNLEIPYKEEFEVGCEGISEFEKHENENKKKLKEPCEWREECEEQQEITPSEECWEVNYSHEREDAGRSDEVLRQDFDERRLSHVHIGEGSEETLEEDYESEKSVKHREPPKDEDTDEIPEGIYVVEENDGRLKEEAPEWVDMYEMWKGMCQTEENMNALNSDIDEHVNKINTDEDASEHEETLEVDDAYRWDEIKNQSQNQESCSKRDGVQGVEEARESVARDEVCRITEITKDSGELENSQEVKVNLPNGVNEKEMFKRACLAQVSIKCDDIMNNMEEAPEAPRSDGIDIGEINVNFECVHNPSACDLKQRVEALGHEVQDGLEEAMEADVEVEDDPEDAKEAEVPLDHQLEDLKQHVEALICEVEDDHEDVEEAEVVLDHRLDDLKQDVEALVHDEEDDPEDVKEAEVVLNHKVDDLKHNVEAPVHEVGNDLENAKEAEAVFNHGGETSDFKAVDAEGIENGKTIGSARILESENETVENAEDIKKCQNTESSEMDLNGTTVTIEMKTQHIQQKEVELHEQHLMAKDEEKVRKKEKDRIAVERAIREVRARAFADARERVERAAVERATSEARGRVKAKAQERLEKASAEAKSVSEKADAKLRAERAAVERATAEARERALKKAMSEKASFNSREHAERFSTEKFSDVSRKNGTDQRFSSLDPQFQSSGPSSSSKDSNSLNHGIHHTTERFDGARDEAAQRCQAKLERHQRTVERAAKALAEKNMRDLLAQKEQAERNRLAEALDAEVKRWSSGKLGNLRALLSTLQYILGSDSGWQPVALTEILNPDAAKKAYRKAALYVHPDKLQQRGATIQQKYICEKVFDLLQDAWNKFNS